MRTRTKTQSAYRIVPRFSEEFYDGRTALSCGAGVSLGRTETMVDNITPNFAARQRKGEVIMNPMTKTEVTTSLRPATYVDTWNHRHVYQNGNWYGGFLNSVVTRTDWSELSAHGALYASYEDMSQHALNDALASAKRAVYMSLVDILQAKKTLLMLKNPAGALNNLIKVHKPRPGSSILKSQVVFKPHRSFDVASDLWLEWRYGWMPLMYSIQDICKAYVRQNTEAEGLKRISTHSNKYISSYSRDSETTRYFQPFANVPDKASDVFKTKVSGTKSFRATVISDQSNVDVSHLYGVDMSSLPGTLWELVPYSFVIDWFLNLGDWIEAQTNVPGFQLRGCCVSSIEETTVTKTGTYNAVSISSPLNNGSGSSDKFSRSAGSYEFIELTKIKDRRVVNPTAEIVTPSLDGLLNNLKHQLDAIALLYKGFGRGRVR